MSKILTNFFFTLLFFCLLVVYSCFLFLVFLGFFLFFLFFPRRFVPLIVACLFLFFLFTSFNSSIFPCPSRWCRIVILKTVVYGNQVRFESLKNSAGTCTKSDKCYIVTYVDSHLHTCTYICRIIHSDTTIKTQEEKRRKTSLQHIYLSLYCKGSKGLFKVCMWEGAGDRT